MKSRKNRAIRGSISVKLNILIVMIILIVAGLLMIISNSAYRRAVFRPLEQKLNSLEVVEDTFGPVSGHFLKVFQTDEFQEAKARSKSGEREDSLGVWMISQPPFLPESDSMYHDWLSVSMGADYLWESENLESISVELSNGQENWRIYQKITNRNETYAVESNLVGDPGAYFPELSAQSCETATQIRTKDQDLYMRCIQFTLDNGWECRIWLSVDITEALQEYRKFLVTCTLAVLGLTIFFSIVMMLILQRQVSRPVIRMAHATRMFLPGADGTYSADSISKVQISSKDELGDLNRDIRSMQEQIVENMEKLARMTAEKERINTEMNLARDIQASALPNVFPEKPEFCLYASMTPARDVGGDFYDFFPVDEDHLALVIADVSGKGIPAALFMMKAKSLIKNQLMADCDPAKALEQVNAQLFDGNTSMMFVTVWLAVLELSTGKGKACNAGHENPCLRRGGEGFELLEYPHDRFVGAIRNAKYHNRDFELRSGDCVFVYTDGVPEAISTAGEMFGEKRLLEVLNRIPEVEPKELILRLHDAVDGFANGAEQFDDITMLCLEYRGKGKTTGSTDS